MLKQQIRLASRHLLRHGIWVRNRAEGLLARERDPLVNIEVQVESALFKTLRAATRLPAYRDLLPKLPRQGLRKFLLDEVPVLDKAILRDGREIYYPNHGRCMPWWSSGKTSGTTGMPLEVFRSFDSVLWEQAFAYQHWQWAGHAPKSRQVVLRGDLVVPIEQRHPPYWLNDRVANCLYISTRHLNEFTAPVIADAIADFGARQLRAYPSAAYVLARLASDHQLNITFDSVQTSSECLYPAQRQLIEQAFGAQVFDLYGMAERVAFGMECEHGRMHMNSHYAHVEILDAAGRPTEGVGQLVGTTLHNLVMPLLRYRLNDSAQWDRRPCPCGRSYPVITGLVGKIEETVFDLDGREVSPSVITFAFKGIEGIAKSQVAQVARDRWELRLVPGPGYAEDCARKLLSNMTELVSARLNTSICLCEDIPNLPSGKFKWVTQEWPEAPRSFAGKKDQHVR